MNTIFDEAVRRQNEKDQYNQASLEYEGQANNAIQNMISAANNALADTKTTLSNVSSYTGDVKNTADKVGQQADSVTDYANKVANTADTLTPYAQSMKDYAEKIYGQGNTLVDQGNDLLGQWSQFSPLVGKYVNSLNQLDPNSKVSQAAADVQSAYQNTQGQNARTLSRMGVDPSSGAYQAQKQQWDTALATALAGAKTRARNTGLNEQIAALGSGLQLGSGLAQAGAQIGSEGTNAMVNAGNVLGNAANVVQAQGNLYGNAGNLQSAAGNLNVSQGNLVATAGELATKFDMSTQQAQSLLTNALDSAAQYYSTQAQGYGQAAKSVTTFFFR